MAFRWPDGVPMGLRHGDGSISINPHPDKTVAADDDVLILAEDDSTIDFRALPVAPTADIPLVDRRAEPQIERELIIGWTAKVEIILREYADYVKPGSQIDIMLRAPDASVREQVAAIDAELDDIDIRLLEEDPLSTEGLLAVEPFHYDNIIILSQAGEGCDDERTDSETIVNHIGIGVPGA